MIGLLGIICAECGCAAPRRGNMQKYCVPCSEKKDIERKCSWQHKNPQIWTPEKTARGASYRNALRERGAQKSAEQSRRKLGDDLPDLVGAAWYVRFTIPFMGSVSKNYIWGFSGKGKGHVYKRQESKQYRDSIALTVRRAVSDTRVFNNKVWLDFHIQKPTHKSDAINVVDLICDAIKDGLGVDDRWFAIRRLDWEIVKSDPQIYIGISQEDQFDAQACSYCGSILPLEKFGFHRSNKSGRHRICMDCSSKKRAEAA